jgi:hypothetical protein
MRPRPSSPAIRTLGLNLPAIATLDAEVIAWLDSFGWFGRSVGR